MRPARSVQFPHLLALILLALTWGSSFILMKKGLRADDGSPVFTPNQVAALRLTIAGLALLPVSVSAVRHIRRTDWKWIMVVGLVGSGGPAFLFTNSQHYLDSSVAGILNALTPLFTLIVGMAIFRRVAEPRQAMGVLIGLFGAACLVSLRGFGNSENWAYSLLIVLATFSYGLSVNTVQHKLAGVRSLHITALSLFFAAIPSAVYLWTQPVAEVVRSHPHGWMSWYSVLTLALLGTAGANMLYFWLTQQTTALFASSVTYIMPLVAAGWGMLDGEPLTWLHAVCGGTVIAGVWLVNKKPKGS